MTNLIIKVKLINNALIVDERLVGFWVEEWLYK